MWKDVSPLRMLVLITQLGILMLVPIVGCTVGAAWIGERLHASWLAVPGFALGAAAGMRACFRIIRRMTSDWPTDEVYKAESDSALSGIRRRDVPSSDEERR